MDGKKVANQFLEKTIQFLQSEETLQKIRFYVIDPVLNHILERIFPYIILSCVLFGLLLIIAISTFVIALFQMKSIVGGVAGGAVGISSFHAV